MRPTRSWRTRRFPSTTAFTRAKPWKHWVGASWRRLQPRTGPVNSMTKPHLLGVLAGLFLAAALLLSAMLVTRAWLKIAESQTISVTGSARKAVRSDRVIWLGRSPGPIRSEERTSELHSRV